MDPVQVAKASAEKMWAEDEASRGLGMRIVDIQPGTATLTMVVTEKMLNGHEICHGGYIFLLADSAFAFACNTYNRRTVAQHCALTFLKSAKLGDSLQARAVERSRTGRSGIYDVTVTLKDGTAVAEFRGHSRTIEGEIVPGLSAAVTARNGEDHAR